MLRPLFDKVVVLPDEMQTIASSVGIVIPQRAGMQSSQEQLGRVGTVVAVGPGKIGAKGRLMPLAVKAGDRVTWGEFQFQEFHEAGKTYAVLQEADITGVIQAALAA